MNRKREYKLLKELKELENKILNLVVEYRYLYKDVFQNEVQNKESKYY